VITISSCTIINTQTTIDSKDGGFIYFSGEGRFILYNSTFITCTTTRNGGVVFGNTIGIEIVNCSFNGILLIFLLI
jgi:hypothetical protein